jgi:hypothetical protein
MLRLSFVLILALLACCFGFSLIAAHGGVDHCTQLLAWVKFYREGLRAPLFAGFLTVGTFLLTLQTTLLLRIKEIYDDESYAIRWQVLQEQRRAKGLSRTGYYDPLRNLGLALLANIFFALVSSILQVTLGFVNTFWAVGICLGFAATTFGLLLLLWWQIAANLIRWFSEIETKKMK